MVVVSSVAVEIWRSLSVVLRRRRTARHRQTSLKQSTIPIDRKKLHLDII